MDDQGRYSVAALAGAALYAFRYYTGTWQKTALLIFSGWSFAFWVGPALIEFFHVESDTVKMGCTLLFGYYGDKVLTILDEKADMFIRHHISTLLKK